MNARKEKLNRARLVKILSDMPGARVGVIGDLCLDAYWTADMTKSVLSRETPYFPLPVVKEAYSPGSAGNVAVNVRALGCGDTRLVGVVGSDWRGELLLRAIRENGLPTDGITVSSVYSTNAYLKPVRCGFGGVCAEGERLDFVNTAPLIEADEARVLECLAHIISGVDVVCVCDQTECGCVTSKVRDMLSELGRAGKTVIVDSRERIALYAHAILKPNALEAVRAICPTGAFEGQTAEELARVATALSQDTRCMVLMTMGENGSLLADARGVTYCPAFPAGGEVDICGAGDTYLAAFACALAVGADAEAAMQVASLASSVTIRKLGTTGTATKEEIVSAWDALAPNGEGETW